MLVANGVHPGGIVGTQVFYLLPKYRDEHNIENKYILGGWIPVMRY